MSAVFKFGLSAAILATSMTGLPGVTGGPLGVAQAEARDWHRRGGRHDGFDLGDAVVGAAVVGGLIAVLSAAGNKRDRDRRDGYPQDDGRWYPDGSAGRGPDNRGPDNRGPDNRGPDNRGLDNRGWNDRDWNDRDWDRRSSDERAAIDTCAREAEYLGARYGDEARVRTIDNVDRDGGDYRVQGEVQVHAGSDAGDRYRRPDRGDDGRAFTCYARGDRVTDFRFEDGFAGR